MKQNTVHVKVGKLTPGNEFTLLSPEERRNDKTEKYNDKY